MAEPMRPMCTIVLATTNEAKARDLRARLGDLPCSFVTLAAALGDDQVSIPVEGATFEENAEKKARFACEATGLVSLADDSGLEVDALAGRPGVRSARFAHERATDAENNAALLRAMDELEDDSRTARYRCVLALASPWSPEQVVITKGSIEGSIARTPRGSGGFGYESLLVVDGDRALAELDDHERTQRGHRATAARAMRAEIARLLDARLDEVEAALG